MKRLLLVLTAALTAGVLAAQTSEPVDSAAIAKIRDEGLNRSQIMDTMFWLTDRYGPRLMGSPEFEEAGDWAVKQLQSWGVANVHKERFAFGNGWSLVNFHATMTSPRVMPIIGVPKSWTPGIDGTFTADVVRPVIANAADCGEVARPAARKDRPDAAGAPGAHARVRRRHGRPVHRQERQVAGRGDDDAARARGRSGRTRRARRRSGRQRGAGAAG